MPLHCENGYILFKNGTKGDVWPEHILLTSNRTKLLVECLFRKQMQTLLASDEISFTRIITPTKRFFLHLLLNNFLAELQ